VNAARAIHYWGHYPVVDMEFETSASVEVGVRAWAPFLPGDSANSNTPAAMFEVHLRNTTSEIQRGSFLMNFPGPTTQEAGSMDFVRSEFGDGFRGLEVKSAASQVGFVLGVLDEQQVRFGRSLTSRDWSNFATRLPQAEFRSEGGQRLSSSGSAAGAVDFTLKPGESKIVRYLLAWYAPVWKGAQREHQGAQPNIEWKSPAWLGDQLYYTNMYATRFNSAYEVAHSFAARHAAFLQRILEWQAVIYNDAQLPGWLQDSLINNLHLIAEDSYWAQPKPPLGEWAFPQGIFGMNESSRGCPHMDCIPCDWYGNLPLVYFFPDLALSTLNGFRHYQRKDGEIPFAFGQLGDLADFASPEFTWQKSLNGTCYIEMLYRLWRRTGNKAVLKDYYKSACASNDFTMALSKLPGHVIRMPDDGGMEWFEHGKWAGMATHMGGLHLAQLRQMAAMAKEMDDRDYEKKCEAWLQDGMKTMEREMWNKSYYLNYKAPEQNDVSDDVMAYQLDGEWAVRFHGLKGVFRPDRVSTTLKTVKRLNVALTPEIGAANFVRPDGQALDKEKKAKPGTDTIATQNTEEVSHYGLYTMFVAELAVLGMTYIQDGDQAFGLEMIRKHWDNLVIRQRLAWDLPNMVDGKTGTRIFGTDYYQAMMLWAVPSVVKGKTMEQFCAPDELVARIMDAAKRDSIADNKSAQAR
jgi:uncharacterized protein (DUF608 family)